MEFFANQFQIFVVLFARMLALLSLMPAFGGAGVPFFYRMALSFIISMIATPVMNFSPEFYELVANRYLYLILEQILIGFLIGISLQIVFAAFQMAGEFFSVQMGFGISEVFDPLAQISLPLMGTIKNLIALYVFFISSAHLMTFQAIVQSFTDHPYFALDFLNATGTHQGILQFLTILGSAMFIIGLKIAFPIMGTLMLVSTTLGLLSKAAPQMNILMLGFPLKIIVAFLVLTWVSPYIVKTMFTQFETYFQHLDSLLRSWNPN